MSNRRFTIYGLVDPRDGLVHYVGRTLHPKARLSAHISPSGLVYHSGKARQTWIKGLADLGLRPDFRVLREVDGFEQAIAAETEMIAKGRAEGWPLTNRVDTGSTGGLTKEQLRDHRRGRARFVARIDEIRRAVELEMARERLGAPHPSRSGGEA